MSGEYGEGGMPIKKRAKKSRKRVNTVGNFASNLIHWPTKEELTIIKSHPKVSKARILASRDIIFGPPEFELKGTRGTIAVSGLGVPPGHPKYWKRYSSAKRQE